LKPLIIENIQMAGILRGSDEDFKNIFGAKDPDEAWAIVKGYCKCLVYTANADGVFVRTTSYSGRFPVKKIIPVSTIGAGDNFNAGMITAIFNNGIEAYSLDKITGQEWSKIISTAVEFATDVCLSYENYIGLALAKRYFSASRHQI
jgi:fructokinase